MKKDDGFWTALQAEFHDTVGIMGSAVVPYKTLESATDALLVDIESEDGSFGTDVVDTVLGWADGFAEQVAVWTSLSGLRTGA